MRRKDKEITAKEEMEAIIKRSLVCRIALCKDDQPYIVPLCFGYRDGLLYFHSAPEGRKIDMLLQNPNVCFEFDAGAEVISGESACEWGMRYQSIIGLGKARIVEDMKEKKEALDAIMAQYADGSFSFSGDFMAYTAVIRVDIESMTCKESKGD